MTASVVSEVIVFGGGVRKAPARRLCPDEVLPFDATAASSKVGKVSRRANEKCTDTVSRARRAGGLGAAGRAVSG